MSGPCKIHRPSVVVDQLTKYSRIITRKEKGEGKQKQTLQHMTCRIFLLTGRVFLNTFVDLIFKLASSFLQERRSYLIESFILNTFHYLTLSTQLQSLFSKTGYIFPVFYQTRSLRQLAATPRGRERQTLPIRLSF